MWSPAIDCGVRLRLVSPLRRRRRRVEHVAPPVEERTGTVAVECGHEIFVSLRPMILEERLELLQIVAALRG